MLIRQYAYFAIVSRVMHPDVVTDRLGVRPDEVIVKGSRSLSPLRPAFHRWMISCRTALPVDEQLAEIVQRLRPIQEEIGHLADELASSEGDDVGTVVEVVRYFNDPEGVDEVRRVSLGVSLASVGSTSYSAGTWAAPSWTL